MTARANEALQRVGIHDTPYLVDLREGRMSLESFRETQRQFYFAVEFFSRPMAALVAKIPDPRMRLDILHNVVEEHGEFDKADFHETTFKAFLRSIGARTDDLSELVLWPEVRAFNATLAGTCIHDELDVGVSTMGVIEHAFAGISASIGQSVVDRGWVEPQDLIHYKLHAQIDERHAEEFFRVVEPGWDDPARRYYIEQGIELGLFVFDQLYRGFHRRTLGA